MQRVRLRAEEFLNEIGDDEEVLLKASDIKELIKLNIELDEHIENLKDEIGKLRVREAILQAEIMLEPEYVKIDLEV